MVTLAKKKVLFFVTPNCGGAERMTLLISKFLNPLIYEVKIVVVGPKVGSIESFIPKHMSYVHFNILNKWSFMTLRLYNFIKSEKADFVFCSLMYLNVRVILAAKLYGKCKSIVRCDNYLHVLRFDDKILVKYVYKLADKIVAQQDEMRNEFLDYCKLDKSKIISLHNPTDTELIDSMSKDSNPYLDDNVIKFVAVGHIMSQKGFDLLIESFSIYHKQNSNSHLYIIGECIHNDYYNQLQSIVMSFGLKDFVTFTGFKKNPYVWVKYADCFVLSSRFEGLPNVLLDAMYLRVPVAAFTCIPIIKRMIEEGVNGYTAEPLNVKQLAFAMEKAILIKSPKSNFKSASKADFVNLFEQ